MQNVKRKAKKVRAIADYHPSEIEKRWREVWEKNKLFSPDLGKAKKPFYNLMMFPYPSAEGLHVGNMYAFTGADVHGRFMRMKGFDVFEPIGLDGFGIHSENYAIKVRRHPKEQAQISEKNFYRQLKSIGNSYDWSRTVETHDPVYYRWTQWLFIQMFKKGLAYRKKAPVNFCPSCKTVLADEQIIEGACERCETKVELKKLEQWFFKITAYAEKLLAGIEKIDWPEKIKIAQRNWIGKSEDIQIDFPLKRIDKKLSVITTRPDTIFGVTFMVIAPEHELIQKLKDYIKNWNSVSEYIKKVSRMTEFERGLGTKKKTGILLEGLVAVNPANGEEVPVYTADYVLATYGTGAIMAVPGHDDRDFSFAKNFDLPIITVVEQPRDAHVISVFLYDTDQSILANSLRNLGQPMEYWTPTQRKYDIDISYTDKIIRFLAKEKIGSQSDYKTIKKGHGFALEIPTVIDFGFVYSGDGIHTNSDFLNGLRNEEAIKKITGWLERRGLGKRTIHYHLRDWLISRQRYWGPPIPMIYCKTCGWQPVPENELPVVLPDVEDFKPKGDGSTPLSNAPDSWKFTKCPACGQKAQRELEVSDTFLDSSWYFLAYLHIQNGTWVAGDPFDEKILKKWLPVNAYIGGAEHAVLHLLYARFIWMVLSDCKFLPKELGDEPFPFLFSHGLIVKNGAKMSKSRGNVVVPDQYIEKYGADALRSYLMFLGPYDMGGDFRDSGIEGMDRFLKRVWKVVSIAGPAARSSQTSLQTRSAQTVKTQFGSPSLASPANATPSLRMMHKTIKKVTKDIEDFRYNTAIASLMEWYNFLSKQKTIVQEEIETLLLLLAPFAPHITEELYQRIMNYELRIKNKKNHNSLFMLHDSIHGQSWPVYNEKYLQEESATIVIQINGKTRSTCSLSRPACRVQQNVEELAKSNHAIQKYLQGKRIKRTIYIEARLINFVLEN